MSTITFERYVVIQRWWKDDYSNGPARNKRSRFDFEHCVRLHCQRCIIGAFARRAIRPATLHRAEFGGLLVARLQHIRLHIDITWPAPYDLDWT